MRELVLQLQRAPGLDELAARALLDRLALLLRRLRLVEPHVLDVLHGQRRAALHGLAGLLVLHHRADERLRVDAVVLVEPAVLDRDDRLPHHLGDLAGPHDLPVLRVEGGDRGAVVGQHHGGLLGHPGLDVTGLVVEGLDAVPRGEPEPAGDRKQNRRDEHPGDADCASELHDTDQFPYHRTSHAVQTTCLGGHLAPLVRGVAAH